MKNKKNIILVASFVVLAIVSFYAGTKFPGNKNTNQFAQNMNGARNQNGSQFQKGARMGNGNIIGKIISRDADSITVELNTMGPNNKQNVGNQASQTGSKIVFYTNTTSVLKTTTGTVTDLVVGANVNIAGTSNTDGSISATSVQIR